MSEDILALVHGASVLLFGVCLSMSFIGLRFSRRNVLLGLCFCAASGAVQALLLQAQSLELPVKLYPLVSHLPLMVFSMKQPSSKTVLRV